MECQKHLFHLSEEVAYLNCAYMSPQLRRVEAVGHAMVSVKNEPYHILPEDFFSTVDELRANFACLVGLSDPKRVALIPSVSYGMANIARNIDLHPSQHVLVAGEQFPSNYYPWKRLGDAAGAKVRIVDAPRSGGRTEAWNEAILAAIDRDTALVALSHTHWADGTRFDLAAIRKRSRELGALLVIDGTQSVGALPFDVEALQPDALICAGYKWLLGPYALGLAFYGPAFDGACPVEENWINRMHSEDFQHLVRYQEAYQPGASRFSVGEQSNFILVPMLNEALKQLLEWGVYNIQRYCLVLSQEPLHRLREMGGIVEPEKDRCGHLFGVRLGNRFEVDRLQQHLRSEGVFVSFRGNAVRIAPHVYNDQSDFDRLLRCFESARKQSAY